MRLLRMKIINLQLYITMNFKSKQPCNNCPYRKDAPLQLWHKEEFAKLLEEDKKQFGANYGCHKKNGHICVGWLMNQDERNFPNLNLRLLLSKKGISRDYLDNLKCSSEMYNSIQEMIESNFPELLISNNESK